MDKISMILLGAVAGVGAAAMTQLQAGEVAAGPALRPAVVAAAASSAATPSAAAPSPAIPSAAAPAPLVHVAVPKATRTVEFKAPRDETIAAHPNGAEILYGRRLLTDTKRLLPDNVGSGLNCTSCHPGGAKVAGSAPFVGVSVRYPMYNPRAARVVDLVDRINGCFLRSMNGKPVPRGSREMKAMVAYFQWLSTYVPADANVRGGGMAKIDQKLVPDPVRGQQIYAAQCASCHGENGEGRKDARGEFAFPPLWGDESFNIGAGMARTYTAAAFVKATMPFGHTLTPPLGQGGLTDQEAIDVSEYFSHQPRPDFAPKVNDWPKGNKPKDARY